MFYEVGICLEWIVGIFIGVINLVIVVGSLEDKCVENLCCFWELVILGLWMILIGEELLLCCFFNEFFVFMVVMVGVNGFYKL